MDVTASNRGGVFQEAMFEVWLCVTGQPPNMLVNLMATLPGLVAGGGTIWVSVRFGKYGLVII